jgi:hypothetical protein
LFLHLSSIFTGEEVAKWAGPGAKVVKAFNTIGCNLYGDPQFGVQSADLRASLSILAFSLDGILHMYTLAPRQHRIDYQASVQQSHELRRRRGRYRPALHSSRFADIAGDDEGAKQAVAALAADLGFAPLDVGPLSQARYTEPLAMLWITLVCLWSFFHLLCSAHLARRISRSLAAITLSSSSESELFVPI